MIRATLDSKAGLFIIYTKIYLISYRSYSIELDPTARRKREAGSAVAFS
jgi:hypothetical protein